MTYSTLLGVGRRSSSGAVTRSVAASSRAEAAEQLVDVYTRIAHLHHQGFPVAQRTVAPPPPAVDEAGIRKQYRDAALKGISVFARARRSAVASDAAGAADRHIAETRAEWARQHADYQRWLDAQWRALHENDPSTVMAVLAAAFEDNDAAAAPLGVVDDEAAMVVIVPAASGMPQKKPDITPTGRPTIKAVPKKEAADWHKIAVAGCMLVTVKEAFAVAPGVRSIRIVATTMPEPDAYWNRKPEVLVAARFERAKLAGVHWSTVDSIRILNDITAELRLRSVGVTKALAPLDLSDEPELEALLQAIDFDELGA